MVADCGVFLRSGDRIFRRCNFTAIVETPVESRFVISHVRVCQIECTEATGVHTALVI
jgi:hypothetical protein